LKKKLFTILKFIGIILFVVFLGGFIYLNMATYDPMEEANNLLSDERVEVYKDYYVINPEGEAVASLVYYQGGLVETGSYLPFAMKLADEGVRVYLLKMPFNLAILNQDAFLTVKSELEIDAPVLIAGHSLGGASASLFLDGQDDLINGLIFLASYPPSSVDLSSASYQVLSITASRDGVLDLVTFEEGKALLPSNTLYEEIFGGNHAQFGDYGVQNGDNTATISRDDQQDQIVALIMSFIGELDN
jgi:hypothetical protein